MSIVVPVYNESDNLRHFYAAICEEMAKLHYDWELIFVNDGSTDNSKEILLELEQQDSHVQPIFLAKNSGHQLALTCGLDHADGDAVIFEILHELDELCRECFCEISGVEAELEEIEFEGVLSEGILEEFVRVSGEGLHDVEFGFEVLDDAFDAE